MKHLKDVMKIAKKQGAKFVRACPPWKGREVWQLLFVDPKEGMQEIGIPTLVVFGWSGGRILSDKEVAEYMEQTGGQESPEEEIIEKVE